MSDVVIFGIGVMVTVIVGAALSLSIAHKNRILVAQERRAGLSDKPSPRPAASPAHYLRR